MLNFLVRFYKNVSDSAKFPTGIDITFSKNVLNQCTEKGAFKRNTPQKVLREPAPLRSQVAPQRCLLSSVCAANIRSSSEPTKYFRDFFSKRAKKNAADHRWGAAGTLKLTKTN